MTMLRVRLTGMQVCDDPLRGIEASRLDEADPGACRIARPIEGRRAAHPGALVHLLQTPVGVALLDLHRSEENFCDGSAARLHRSRPRPSPPISAGGSAAGGRGTRAR